MNLKGGQFFCLTEGKGHHDWTGHCRQHFFSLEVVVVLIPIHPFRAISGVIVDTNEDKEKSSFFLIVAGISG